VNLDNLTRGVRIFPKSGKACEDRSASKTEGENGSGRKRKVNYGRQAEKNGGSRRH
jgi:hypothetical protein